MAEINRADYLFEERNLGRSDDLPSKFRGKVTKALELRCTNPS
jgi:hypothetical protein